VAKKYGSQALEADALHFSTDVWSSSVVLAGLGLVALAERTGVAWLHKADAAAALGVAGIVVWVSIRLGRRTIADLVDEVPPGIRDDVHAALRLPGVVEVGRVRLRRSGPDAFADVTLRVPSGLTLARGHEIADAAEAAVQRLLPGADVVVHVEPSRPAAGGGLWAAGAGAAGGADEAALPPLAREVAAREGLGVHDVVVHEVLGRRSVEMHLEVCPSLTVSEAHARATALERALRDRVPSLERIVTHIEPAAAEEPGPAPAGPVGRDEVLAALARLQREIPGGWQPHDVAVRQEADGAAVSLHCLLAADLAITEAHDFTEEVERALRRRLPGLARVVIHVEPPDHRHG
jgi:divalent metal cation (Fe/Co/Zn/Cd) transporter